MQYSSQRHNSQPSSGFTLVEILVIAPIVLLAIGGFISLMVAMVSDVMVMRRRYM
jgi:Tfp pilus assembly protein PilW